MKPQRTHANDDGGIDWDGIWSTYVQQSDAPLELKAANDNTDDREPSGFGLAVVVIIVMVVGLSCIGAIQ
ncbi:hypothetical protein [Brevundimonas sp. GCM10030266]|uniref:hypothetical protein n=1 Tax=Brevundimonas sp. GCM10030266 TaxID=3273386 RepID=UPI00360E080D